MSDRCKMTHLCVVEFAFVFKRKIIAFTNSFIFPIYSKADVF